MHEERIILQGNDASFSQSSDGSGRTGRDDDGFQCHALELIHGLLESQASAQQGADLAGTSAEYSDIEVTGAVNDILGAAADQRQQLHHFLDTLAEKGRLGVVMDRADLTILFLSHTDRQGNAQGIGILHGDGALDTGHVRGQADVIIVCGQKGFDIFQRLHVFAAEGHMAVVMVCQLIAGAGTADGVEVDIFTCGLTLGENGRIGDQGAVFQIDHTLGDSQKRDSLRKDRQDLITEPVQAEAGYAAQNQVRALQSLFQLFNLIIFDAVMEGPLQCDMKVVLSEMINDLPVQRRSDQADFMSVLKSRKCDC